MSSRCVWSFDYCGFADFPAGPRLSLYSAVECAKACAEGCCSSFFHNAETKTCILSSTRHPNTARLRLAPGYNYNMMPDSNWTSFEGQCYMMSYAVVTHNQAQTACSALGGFLARTDSLADDKFMRSQAGGETNKNQKIFWIGLTRYSGGWMWGNGSLLTQPFWCKGEPNNRDESESENCVEQRSQGWNDMRCKHPRHFLCEKRIQ